MKSFPDLNIEKPLSFGGPADMKTINYLHMNADSAKFHLHWKKPLLGRRF
jgi:hypothetical protein